jgi:PPM family protein phosphatase
VNIVTNSATPLGCKLAGASDIGRVRDSNEDTIVVGDLDSSVTVRSGELIAGITARGQRGYFAVVCDGMGGTEGGEIASELTASVMWREMASGHDTSEVEVAARLLRRAVRVANREVLAAAKRDDMRGMGTTAVAAAVIADSLVIANVGDSRVYVLRAQQLCQVTRDQSLASVLLAYANAPDAAAHAGGAILQAIGVADDVEPSLSIAVLRQGDRVLMCSDGLHGMLADDVLQRVLRATDSPAACVATLVQCACDAGGGDNISCIVMDFFGDRFIPASDSDEVEFREFDPQQEGMPALTTTSYVNRRLAMRIGIATDAGPPPLPVTGQHQAVLEEALAGPARRGLGRHRRTLWLMVVAVALLTSLAILLLLASHF